MKESYAGMAPRYDNLPTNASTPSGIGDAVSRLTSVQEEQAKLLAELDICITQVTYSSDSRPEGENLRREASHNKIEQFFESQIEKTNATNDRIRDMISRLDFFR